MHSCACTCLVSERSVLWACRNKKKWKGPLQYEDKTSKSLMMLPTDMALVWDKKFRPYVELYAKDDEKFFDVSAPALLAFFKGMLAWEVGSAAIHCVLGRCMVGLP